MIYPAIRMPILLYIIVNQVTQETIQFGRKALLAKINIASIRANPNVDCQWLGIKWVC